jgi:hypothetical protein
MNLIADEDVRRVLEFMQSTISADRLVAVATGVHALAPIVWGHFEAEGSSALRLVTSPLNAPRAEHIRRDARSPLPELVGAGDGFEAEAS